MNIFGWFPRKEVAVLEHRSAIKSQAEPIDLPYSDAERQIIDRFEKLPRSCRRLIERDGPKDWQSLHNAVSQHLGHNGH